MTIVYLVYGCILLVCLWGCVYFLWQVYLLGCSECKIAVLDEIVKGSYYRRHGMWVYTAYVRVTYKEESFRVKMKFGVRQRLGFAPGYEIPVTVSRSKRGKVRVFQEQGKAGLVMAAAACGFGILVSGLVLGLALSAM